LSQIARGTAWQSRHGFVVRKFRGASTRKAAVEAARIAQGIEGVTIMNEDGRVYVPDEFDAFLSEEK
jgi:hypothetical protein